MKPSVLIVEDEPAIADNIVYALKTEGFNTSWVQTAGEAGEQILIGAHSLMILDVGLPDRDGFELARDIRRWSEVPIIFVTARSDEVDRIVGLEIGADDYVVKPFSPRELTARVKAVLRRSGKHSGASGNPYRGPFNLDEERCEISFHSTLLTLSRYEYKLLALMIKHPGKVYSRESLMARIWDDPDMSLERTVDTHIKTIRRKLKAVSKDGDLIVTHRGLGYSLRWENRE